MGSRFTDDWRGLVLAVILGALLGVVWLVVV